MTRLSWGIVHCPSALAQWIKKQAKLFIDGCFFDATVILKICSGKRIWSSSMPFPFYKKYRLL
jgi:hypothetical protein